MFSVALAHQMRKLDIETTIVFIQDPQPLASRLLDDEDVPYITLGFGHGRDVLRHPRHYAAGVARAGPDGVLLVSCGFMGAALRAGGYRAPIVAIEHGDVLEAQFYSKRRRALHWIGRMSGAWADDVEVAVSDFVLRRLRRQPHTDTLRRIYNGIDPDQYFSEGASLDRGGQEECIVAFAGRLVYGKGADHLIEAVAELARTHPVRLLIAGDGPERPRLMSLANSLGIGSVVDFIGLEHDMPAFWQMCDIAAIPSTEFTESCPMTTLEAMASGKPVVATRNGGLPELVLEGKTGIVVPPHDRIALAKALVLYANNRELRVTHGASGRARIIEHFHINNCAQAYIDLFDELADGRSPAANPLAARQHSPVV